MNRVTRLFQPLVVVPKNAVVKKNEVTSRSQKLMTEMGLIHSANNGTYHLLPVLQRSIEKLTAIVDEEMARIGGQKMSLPILTSVDLWNQTGRLKDIGREVMTCVDRHNHTQILSPTNEESITALMALLSPISYKQLPIRLYQTGVKFRDEMKPRFGLIRAKEFVMKDMYTFDGSEKAALFTYDLVNQGYSAVMKRLKLDYAKVNGSTGVMGGNLSHEYHLPATIGDDTLVKCNACGHAINKEMLTEESTTSSTCVQCKSTDLNITQGIEVGHTFLLGEKYSSLLGASVVFDDGAVRPMTMGCYGIGITRMIAGSIEVLSSETDIRWPTAIAPYLVCLIAPKQGSREFERGEQIVRELYEQLNEIPGLRNNILVDDRCQLTIGKRMMMANRMGYPAVVVVGSKCREEEPTVEVHLLSSDQPPGQVNVHSRDVAQQLKERLLVD